MNKSRVLLLFAFIIPIAVILLVFRGMEFYPFGDKSLLIMDMAEQYVQYYEYLPYIASGEGSIFFSWSKSLGTNFIGLYAYFLSSPFALLMLLFEDSQLGIFFLTVLKIGLCGAGSFFYFYYVQGCKGPAVLLFTTAYALMSYNIVYSMSLMWLDAVMLLPVILTGAAKMLKGGKPWVFIISLTALIFSNYYTGYMVCLFSVLYITCRFFAQPKDERVMNIPHALGRFAGAFAAAVGLSAWLLLPVFLDLTAGKIGHTDYIPQQMNNFALGEYIKAFLPQTYTSITTGGIPALYTGILTIILCLYYFSAARIRTREKLLTGALFALLLCSFFIIRLDMVWHIFRYPNWFPSRYAFVFQFLAISTACAGWQTLSEKLPNHDSSSGAEPATCPDTGSRNPLNALAENSSLRPLSRNPLNTLALPIVSILLLPLVCLDMGANAKALIDGLDKQFGYKPVEYHADFRAQTKPIIEAVHSMDESFYRMEKTYKHSTNDALGLGYRGVTHYSPQFNRALLDVTKRLGMAQTYIWNGYIGSTPATDSLFNIKYVLSKTPLPYGKALEQSGVAVYENPYVLPVAFAWDSGTALPGTDFNPALDEYDCFAFQNEIYRALGGDDVFTPVHDAQKDGQDYTITSNGEPIYAYFPTAHNTSNSLYLDGEVLVPWYFSTDDNNAAYIGTHPEGTQVVVSVGAEAGVQRLQGEYIYTLDTGALAEITDKLHAGGLDGITYAASGLSGQIHAQRDGSMFISIPYDAGWTVGIDGVSVKPEPALGAFMAVPVSEGTHTVEMSFRPPGLTIGIVISLLTALVIIAVIAAMTRNPLRLFGRL